MMCSWRFLPACEQKITWSTPGLLVAEQVLADLLGGADGAAEPADAAWSTTLAPRRSWFAPAAATASGSKPCSARRCWYSAQTSVAPGAWRPNT